MLALIPGNQSEIIRKAILWTGVLVLLAGIVGGAIRGYSKRAKADDLRGAIEQHGIATVEMLVSRKGDQVGGQELTPWAMVRFEGKLHKALLAVDPDKLRNGQQAAIQYRVGKSGSIYVDRVEPIKN